MKKQAISRKTFFFIFSGFALVILLLSYKTILIAGGNFLAPRGVGNADVVIVENSELIREKGLKMGIDFLSAGRSNLLVIVYQNSETERIFDRPLNYNLLLTQKLELLGLNKEQIKVIEVPMEHPITLTEAKRVLSTLSRSGVKSAILLAEGFHTRRSYWAYKQVGLPLGIKIIPCPYFIKYRNDNWWTGIKGVSDFSHELSKFIYYVLCRYIPVKSLLLI
jgi:hypothetical protein